MLPDVVLMEAPIIPPATVSSVNQYSIFESSAGVLPSFFKSHSKLT
jgi:hypothetical protein